MCVALYIYRLSLDEESKGFLSCPRKIDNNKIFISLVINFPRYKSEINRREAEASRKEKEKEKERKENIIGGNGSRGGGGGGGGGGGMRGRA